MRKLPSSVAEYVAVAGRRWKLFLVPVIVVPCAVFLISRKLPRSYKSTASVLIQTQAVPKNFVDDSMQTDVKDRFESISNSILSQSRLMLIVDSLNLSKQPGVTSREDAMSRLRRDLTIEMESEREERQGSAVFKISYIARTGELAQEVTREVADLAISSNLESRERQAQGNIGFIQDELERAERELKIKEDRLNSFRMEHSDLMPQEAAANMQVFSQTQSLALANSEALERAAQQQTYVQSMLDADAASRSSASPSHIDPLDPTLAQKREELRTARQRYTDKHPDVIRLQAEVKALQNQYEPSTSSDHQAVPTSPGQRQLMSQLAASSAEVHAREQRQAQIEGKLRSSNERVHVSPVIAGQAVQLQSDYDAAQKYYSSLVDKQHASSLSANLEKSRGHDLIQILDPASLPHSPSSPHLQMMNMAGVGLGLFLGLLLALGVDLFDQTLHDQDDLVAYFDVPLIAIIPNY